MATIPKHFGLTAREESYMFKELEKIRQETKKECYQFKEKLAARPVLGASSEDDFEDQDWEARLRSTRAKGRVSWAAKPSSSSRVQSPERPAKAGLQGAPQSTLRRGSGKPEPFRPRDFYLRSSAFLRHRSPKEPPAIAPQAGTTKPASLLQPCSYRRRQQAKSPRESISKRVFSQKQAHEARSRYRKASSLSSLNSEVDEVGRLSRLRIRTYFLRECMGRVRWTKAQAKAGRETGSSGPASMQMTRAIPTSIEEIIASLQSESQLASDQTIKELIQSILGQNYDLTMEGISLMEQMYFGPSQTLVQTPEVEDEKKLQTPVKKWPIRLTSP
ncbi:hypothetical protein STEG23_016509, partial [Scotinomys teguina]